MERIELYGSFAADLSDEAIAVTERSFTDDEIAGMQEMDIEVAMQLDRDMEMEPEEVNWAARVQARDARLASVPVGIIAQILVIRAITEN